MVQELKEIMQEEVFTRLFEQAEIAKFSKKELQEYEESLKAYRDWYSVTKTSFNKGVAEGIEQGRAEGIQQGRAEGIQQGKLIGLEEGERKKAKEIALNMISIGIQSDIIAQATGLTIEDIDNLR